MKTLLVSLLIPVCVFAQSGTYATADDGTALHWTVVLVGDGLKHPGVILLPEGGFVALDGIPSGVSTDLAAAGFTVFNQVQCRLAPPGGILGQSTDGRFPQQTSDVTKAAAAARLHSACNGQVVAIGGSSGGAHACYLAANRLVNAAVLLSSPTKFDDATSRLDTNFATQVDNYSPNNVAGSPYYMLKTTSAPMFVIQWTTDSMPANQYTVTVAQLGSLGATYQSSLVSGSHHAWNGWSTVSAQVIAFMNTYSVGPTIPQ